MMNRDRRRRNNRTARTRRESYTAIRERRAQARVSECMRTFVAALEHAGKTPEEIVRLSSLYELRLDRVRRELWS
jgi:hypothetical protein